MSPDLSAWFGGYLDVFAACGRGERPCADVLGFYAVPLLLTTDDVVLTLLSSDEIASWVQGQMDGMLAADYARSVVLESDTTMLNRQTAMHRASFSRQSRDGSEINHITCSYLITGIAEARRISGLVLHTP